MLTTCLAPTFSSVTHVLQFNALAWAIGKSEEYRSGVIALVEKAKAILGDDIHFCLHILPYYNSARPHRNNLQHPHPDPATVRKHLLPIISTEHIATFDTLLNSNPRKIGGKETIF